MLQQEENLLKLGENYRKSGKRIQLDPKWIENGDKQFLSHIIEGKQDNNQNTNTNDNKSRSNVDDLSASMRRMKLSENQRIEEQGNRLVESKAKSPTLSPKKFNDTRLENIPKFNLAQGLNMYSNVT